jgi:lipopolysaccharide biosynthesis regulator YciM
MPSLAPVGTAVVSGEMYRCTNCGYEIDTLSIEELPACPDCRSREGWELVTDEDEEALAS